MNYYCSLDSSMMLHVCISQSNSYMGRQHSNVASYCCQTRKKQLDLGAFEARFLVLKAVLSC